ncbi:MAG: ribonuclease J [Patescibacteria group bacterium]
MPQGLGVQVPPCPLIKKIKMQKSKIKTNEDHLRFIPLGGLEEIGRNMMLFEYKNEIVIIDAGLQFPEETTPGIDYIIPNVSYLQKKKANIRALIITHGHYDHTGAIPYIMGKIGNPTIYCAALTKAMIAKRQEEFKNSPKLNIEIVKAGDKVEFGQYLQGEFFDLDHTVPDTIGTILKTPAGNLVHFSDFKLDYDQNNKPVGLKEFEKIGKRGVHTLFIDSTNADVPGRNVPEKIVEQNLEKLFVEAKGRIVVATFSSLITRLGEIIKIAINLKRKVFVSGYSMKTNLQIAQNLKYLKFPQGAILPMEEMKKYKDEKIMVLCTGAQGEPNASLMRIANGQHKFIETKSGDTFFLSSSIIPGNERSVQTLKDNLTRQGARVIQSKDIDIHSSGHASEEELKDVIKLIKPKFLIPTHGYYFKRAANRDNAIRCGIKKDDITLIDNGQVAELTKTSVKVTDEQVDASYVMVDGLGVGDVGEIVLRDRRVLAEEGMVVIIITLDKHNGRLLKNPDIISRGFIYLKENKEMLDDIRRRLRSIIERIRHQHIEAEYLKSLIRDQIGEFVYRKTQRRPMILPVVIEV